MKFSRIRKIVVRLLTLAFLIGVLAFGGLMAYLDTQVVAQFEGRRFALPARVYARPLELFPGMGLSPEAFAQELRQLGYRQGLQGGEPGRYERRGNGFDLVTRPFAFWDGAQPSQRLSLSFEGDSLVSLSGRNGTPVNLTRLDPEYIGGIYPSHNEDRVLVKLDEVPPELIKGLIAVEDRNFYSHVGISPRGIARALVATLSGRRVEGGSTITQQLVKNFFLTSERTLKRKATEVLMALLLEFRYEKNDILETYINEVYLGQDKNRAIHGFGLAAQFYFGKHLKDLSPSESALLVGMVKGASYYDPHRHPKRTLERRNVVLDLMRNQKVLTDAEYLRAKISPIGVVTKPSMGTSKYPAFLDLVRRQLLRDYRETDLRSEGLLIFTTLDPSVQAAAEEALVKRLSQLDKTRDKSLEGAVVVTNAQNGEVQALVGGRDPRFQGFNRATDSNRPIGSLLKPAIFLSALSAPNRYTLITPIDDSPLVWREKGRPAWEPKNYDRKNHGMVPLRTALANSYNIPTARLGLDLGVKDLLEDARKLGVERDLPPYASSLLGAVSLSPFEVAQMYQTFASGGFRVPLRAIREVLTPDGKPLQRYGLSVEQVVDPAPAYLLTTALQGVVSDGTARGLQNYLPPEVRAAGKTGTTNDKRDSWFAGYTGDKVAVVWLGYDNNKPTPFTGGSGALTVWGEMMSRLHLEPLEPPVPENVELVWIDQETGLRGTEGCVGSVQIPFITGSAPVELAPCTEMLPPEPESESEESQPRQEGVKGWFQRMFD